MMLNIIKAYAVNNLCFIASQKMIPQGIVVHSTGANNPCLKRYVDAPNEVGINQYGNHWNTAKPNGRKVCVHAFIGYDKNLQIRVAEILPHNICCWGVGKGKYGSYNYDPAYLQLEICEDGLTDKNYYREAFNVATEYCAELCKAYNIRTEKIVGHCEAYRLGYGSNHADPEHWMKKFGETMDDFRQQISKILKNENGNETAVKRETIISDSASIQKGDLVSIVDNATYYNGKSVPYWVKLQNWYVKNEPNDDRVVIDQNEKGTNSICSPIHKKYLTIVKKATENLNVETEVADTLNDYPYLVKVVVDRLDIYKGAGTNTSKVGVITDRGVYTIVEEQHGVGSNKWGKLKSGAGWVSLDYVKKCKK